MKFLDKLALKLFSIVICIISVVLILYVTGIIQLDFISDKISLLAISDQNVKITIIVLAVFILLSLKGLFFGAKKENTGKEGIILENTSGKLVISKESLENMIAAVAKDIPGSESISSKTILDKNKNLIVYVTTVVSKDVILKDISTELQTKIKEAMKRTADLEVKEVNIRIKNITSKKVKILPSANVVENNTNNEEKKAENVIVEEKEEGKE